METTIEQATLWNLDITTVEPEFFQCDSHCKGVLKRLRDREDLCDLVLKAGDKRISAHRVVLVASCDYFSALLSGKMREAQEREIVLKDVDGDALEIVVNYCYTGCFELRGDTIESLITTANYLQMNEIIEGCCKFLGRRLDPSNCLDVLFFAEQLNLETLLHDAQIFICENFEEVSDCPKFLILNAKQLNKIIASDELNVPSEELVFTVFMKWIEYDPKNRQKHFTELLAQVRLPLLPPNFLVDSVEPVCQTMESVKLYVNALKSNIMRSSNSIVLRNRQSKCVEKLLALYKNANGILTVAGYNLYSNQWNIWTTLNDHRRDFAVTMMDENLIIVGGITESRLHQNRVTSIKLQTMASTEMAPLRTSRSEHSVAVLHGAIYVVGGYDGRQSLSSVERWDPVSRTWSFVAPMQSNRRNLGLAVLNDRLYASGGSDNGVVAMSVESYDPVEGIWRFAASMNNARSSHSLVAHKNYLFALGGSNSSLERYDPNQYTWTTISCSPVITNVTTCCSAGSEIFVYNNLNFYMLSADHSDCAHIVTKSSINSLQNNCLGLFEIPMELWLNKSF